jgi:hypothetical protein
MNFSRKGSTICLIEKKYGENKDQFIDRCNFTISQKPNNNNELNKIILLSNIYSNIKYLGCSYDNIIMNQINNLIEKCYVQ